MCYNHIHAGLGAEYFLGGGGGGGESQTQTNIDDWLFWGWIIFIFFLKLI